MKRSELSKRLLKLEENGQIIEAFTLRSMYVDSIITTLATAALCHEKGFDGLNKKVAEAVKLDTKFKEKFEKMTRIGLEKRTKILYEKTPIVADTEAAEIDEWRKDRNLIFHWFAHLMLSDNLREVADRGNKKINKIMERDWFKHMEEVFATMENLLKGIS